MTRHTRDSLTENDPDLLFADGFDDAILGEVDRVGQEAFVLYDARRCIAILLRDNPDMTREEAEEHFSFNVAGAWVGERTPGFVWLADTDDDDDDGESDR
jgi:hypothetical protein